MSSNKYSSPASMPAGGGEVKISGQKEGDGERFLIARSPSFKNRYALDSDFILGCRIGCVFCYYRMIDVSAPYIGTGQLKRLATPEMFNRFLRNSKIFWPNEQLIIISARSDGSMQWQDTITFLDKYFEYNNKVLLLQRAPIFKIEYEYMLSDGRFLFGTTLTPMGYQLGWTKISEEKQLNALEKAISFGIDPIQIAVEIGPINNVTIRKVERLLKGLSEIGIRHIIYRGISIGAFGKDLRLIAKKLQEQGFLDKPLNPETYFDGKQDKKHPFYGLKNFLTKQLENKIHEWASKYDIHLYRHTGLFYYKRWKIPIAVTRRNRIRWDVAHLRGLQYPVNAIRSELEYLGYTINEIYQEKEKIFIETQETVTEDVAMLVSAKYSAPVIFKKYRVSPTMQDVRFYREKVIFDLDILRPMKIFI